MPSILELSHNSDASSALSPSIQSASTPNNSRRDDVRMEASAPPKVRQKMSAEQKAAFNTQQFMQNLNRTKTHFQDIDAIVAQPIAEMPDNMEEHGSSVATQSVVEQEEPSISADDDSKVAT